MQVHITRAHEATAASDVPACIRTAIKGPVPKDAKALDALILDISNQKEYAWSRMMPMSQRQKFANFLDDYVRERIQKTTGMDLPDVEDLEEEDELVDICIQYMRKARMKYAKQNAETLAAMIMDYAP